MCGISGFCDFSLNYYDKKPFWETILVQKHETLKHRGPDQAMIDLQPHVGLSHARLSIRDLKSGIQPMTRTFHGKTCSIVYNGEIYNHRELLPELQAVDSRCTVKTSGVTGVEMEALTGVSTALLTIYDMCKAVDRGMESADVRLLHKEGGRSGVWNRAERQASAVESVAADGATLASAPVAVAPAAPAPVVPAIAFIGYQNSGKTTLVEKVIAELTRRGLRVGSLKHHGHHGFDIDVPAKDTWRHHQAGSKHVGLICATRWAEYADTREEDEMPARELLSRYSDVDVVIIEGYKTEGFDNIVVARSGVDRLRGKSSLDLVDGHTLALACNEALARQAFDAGFATRVININDARAICDLIQDHLA